MNAPRALTTAAAALFAGRCGGTPAGAEACAPYADNPALLASCVTNEAGALRSVDAVIALCDSLPAPDNTTCRVRWVHDASPDPQYEGGDLLRACNGDDDCSFVVLLSRPAPTYEEAIARCDAWAGVYAPDCAGHAALRLMSEGTTPAALRSAANSPHADVLAAIVARYARCAGSPVCPDLGPATPTCQAALAQLPPNPDCPSTNERGPDFQNGYIGGPP